MQKEESFELGYISKAHGLDGKVQAFFDVEDPMYYAGIDAVFLEGKGSFVPYFVEKISHTDGGKFLIKFEEIDDKTSASRLKGAKLFLPIILLPELDEGEEYLHDSIGFKVVDENHGDIGVVDAYIESGPQMIMAIDFKGKEVLVPVHEEIVRSTDFETKTIFVKLPGGLLELYLEE